MKHICPAALAALVAAGAFAVTVRPPAPELKDFRAPVATPKEHVKGFLWLEAEEFSDYGTWVIETQFVGKMGSAYLLGSGVTGCCAMLRTMSRRCQPPCRSSTSSPASPTARCVSSA